MTRLTKAEEEIMQIIWQFGRCTVSDIRTHIEQELGLSKPPHSTVSTFVRNLEEKGVLGHKAYGRTYEYFPLISKEAYSGQTLRKIASDYFDGSMNRLVSFLVKEEDLSAKELSQLLDRLEEE
ncbi:MAG: transcriptional regulator [Saprospiraceae bacterium]|nr:MAG: transcriptional regulator [Saprospiraceae bacterium]